MEKSRLSLKWLEVFQAVAATGSLRDGAERLGLSISTASHHLRCLEDTVGVPLLDHARRPMTLTPEGEALLRRVDEALWLLRKGVSDIWADDLPSMTRSVRIAAIEDLDTDVMPDLAARLTRALPACDLAFLSRPSHEIATLLRADEVDLGIATAIHAGQPTVIEEPLLRDPFILVAPRRAAWNAADYLEGRAPLPFARYSRKQLIGQRVEVQLRRLSLRLPQRLEFESNATLFAMVAAGGAWTIATALTCARARKVLDEVAMMPFPARGFAREIAVSRRDDLPAPLYELVSSQLRGLTQTRLIDPIVARAPWLEPAFRLQGDGPPMEGG